MNSNWLLGALYGLFYLWHNKPWQRPLAAAEIEQRLGRMGDGAVENDIVDPKLIARLLQFLSEDDGQPFYMVNLMEFREKAIYPDGAFPEVKTGRQANALYGQAVIRELLQRGSYPVLLTQKIQNFIPAGPGADFFEDVGIVRYRSRRDLLDMISSPSFQAAEPHKWASLEQTVAVPTRKLLILDLGIAVPLLLGTIGFVANLWRSK